MKICRVCGKEKNFSEFYKDKKCKDGHTSICKKCKSDIKKIRYNRKSEIINRYKSTKGCLICRETRAYVLDFHHIDEDRKIDNVSKMTNLSTKRIIDEIGKCIVLCSNCHRELHYKEIELREQTDNILKELAQL